MNLLEATLPTAEAHASALSGISVDALARRATVCGEELYLSEREFRLLAAMLGDPQRTFTYEELIVELFAEAPGVTRRVLDMTAARLRRKLELRGAPGLIAPCRGVGFRFVESTGQMQPERRRQ